MKVNEPLTISEHPDAAPARRIRVIVNPTAGAKGGLPTNRATADDVRAAMARHNLGDDLVITATVEEATSATREAIAQRYDVVVAAGGDGTVEPIAGELLGTACALGVMPLGSWMNIARMLGVPHDLDGAAAVLATGQIRAIDVGEAKGNLFFEGGSVGLNAVVFAEAQRIDRGHRLRGLLSAIWMMLRYRPPRMILHLDDRVLTTRALAVSIANGPYTGLGFTVSPDAKLDDGLLDVVIFSRFSRVELIRHFGSIAFGRRRYSAKTRTHHSARVRIEGVHPLPCRADDHDLGTTPVEFRVRPAALRVVMPRQAEVSPLAE